MEFGYILHSYVYIKDNGQIGKTKHFVHGQIAPTPTKLKIVSYPEDMGYYLLYIDRYDNEITDTFHDSIELAKKQAQFEFGDNLDIWHDTLY